mmetsp:Transcript_26130/g.85925  ORF Transcript_26130/g.85925 Transcript_26130/m.85925 type:complete len:650 (+) Transcript_26130:198-2147(+)
MEESKRGNEAQDKPEEERSKLDKPPESGNDVARSEQRKGSTSAPPVPPGPSGRSKQDLKEALSMNIFQRARTEIAKSKLHLTAGATRIHGRFSTYNSQRPQEVVSLAGLSIKLITCGSDHVLALDASGKIRSWGRGESGQLGHASFSHSSTPSIIDELASQRVKEVACGVAFSAALMEGGQLYTWGCNRYGQLGQGDRTSSAIPRMLPSMNHRHVHLMACGAAHIVVLTTSRDVYTWGNNSYGQLGHGFRKKHCLQPKSVRVMSGLDIKQIVAGENHSCVMTSFGDIYTWGRGDFGQLGHGDMESKDIPTLLSPLDPKTQASLIVSGADFIMAMTYSGAVYSWGRNCFGQLGHGVDMHYSKSNRFPSDVISPKIISFFAASEEHDAISLSSISCGSHHVLAITEKKDTLFAWGRGEHGQLGLDPRDTSFRPIPQEVKKMKGMIVLAAACSENHSVVVATMPGSGPKGDMKVFSWGRGSFGQLGYGSGKVPVMKETVQDNQGAKGLLWKRSTVRPTTSLGFADATKKASWKSSTDTSFKVLPAGKSSTRVPQMLVERPASCEPRLSSMYKQSVNSMESLSSSAMLQSQHSQWEPTLQSQDSFTRISSLITTMDTSKLAQRIMLSRKRDRKQPIKVHPDDPEPLSMAELLR